MNEDYGIWAGVGLNYEFNKKWKTSLTQEFRSFDDALELHKSITDLGLTYRINKKFKLGVNARYAYARKKDYTFTHDTRFNFDFKFKKKLTKKLDLLYRFRFQYSYINLFTFVPDVGRKANARNRIKIEYDLNKHSIYFASELFREFVVYKDPSFNNLRISLGDQFETALGDFNYALAYERELNETNPLNFFFLKLNYIFELKRD